jgi:secondary thiamine-phosphate synthase enzyme
VSVVVERLKLKTRGHGDVLDITPKVARLLDSSGLGEGVVTVFAPGATAGVTTIEYEPGLIQDLQRAFEGVAPQDIPYAHNERWGDGNGHSHVRASMLGPSLSVPFSKGTMILGTWQQIVVVDFDNRPRRREIVVQIMGEARE